MAKKKSIKDGIKYTVLLPEHDIDQLKILAECKIISSVNSGVREAVEEYIVRIKKELYEKELIRAVNDPDFIRRNEEIEKEFEGLDAETGRMIPKW